MDIYLPLAKMALNAPLLIALGVFAGMLSGLFGVGGGFVLTPLLSMIGVPPAIAVGTIAAQLAGTSASGSVIQWQKRQIDIRMALVLLGGSLCGALAGTGLFSWLRHLGYIDVMVAVSYALLLLLIAGLMLRDSWQGYRARRMPGVTRPRKPPIGLHWPFRMYFPVSTLEISIFAPLLIGFGCGILTAMLGVGGSFVLIPAMFFLLHVPATHLNGTALFQVGLTAAFTAALQAVLNHNIDIVLGLILLVGSVFGVQLGNRLALRLPPEKARFAFALLVLTMALFMTAQLFRTPHNLYTLDLRLPPETVTATPPEAKMSNKLVADLSSSYVSVTTGFSGASLLVFGSMNTPSDLAITVTGPPSQMVVRKKVRVLGLWVERDTVVFDDAPSYFAFATTPFDSATPRTLFNGLDIRGTVPPLKSGDPALARPFYQAMLALEQEHGRFLLTPGSIQTLSGRLFHNQIVLPSSTPLGNYNVHIYSFGRGAVNSEITLPFIVREEGLSARIYEAAWHHSILYAVLSLLLAVAIGSGSALLFQRLRG